MGIRISVGLRRPWTPTGACGTCRNAWRAHGAATGRVEGVWGSRRARGQRTGLLQGAWRAHGASAQHMEGNAAAIERAAGTGSSQRSTCRATASCTLQAHCSYTMHLPHAMPLPHRPFSHLATAPRALHAPRNFCMRPPCTMPMPHNPPPPHAFMPHAPCTLCAAAPCALHAVCRYQTSPPPLGGALRGMPNAARPHSDAGSPPPTTGRARLAACAPLVQRLFAHVTTNPHRG